MSIFEPIVEVRSTEPESVPDAEAASDSPVRGRSFDPRSIKIAGLVGAGLVILGLLVSNAAKPEPEPRLGPMSRVEPGAAAVEHAETAPTVIEATDAPVEAVEPDDDQPEAQDSSTDDVASVGDDTGDRPGKGNGRGHGKWR